MRGDVRAGGKRNRDRPPPKLWRKPPPKATDAYRAALERMYGEDYARRDERAGRRMRGR